jgi:hypothetical protein
MMLGFLNSYSKAVSLDNERFNSIFLAGMRKSDFLLFEESTICEFKEIVNFDAPKRIEHIAKKGITSERNFKRDFYNTIENALSSANQQIAETQTALGIPGALGLVIVENLIPKDLSVLALIDAADRKMGNGLASVDAVLCLDLVNTFVDENGSHIQPAQLVTRGTERSNKLYPLVGNLLEDFSNSRMPPIHRNFNISKADQTWVTDASGRYKSFRGTLKL